MSWFSSRVYAGDWSYERDSRITVRARGFSEGRRFPELALSDDDRKSIVIGVGVNKSSRVARPPPRVRNDCGDVENQTFPNVRIVGRPSALDRSTQTFSGHTRVHLFHAPHGVLGVRGRDRRRLSRMQDTWRAPPSAGPCRDTVAPRWLRKKTRTPPERPPARLATRSAPPMSPAASPRTCASIASGAKCRSTSSRTRTGVSRAALSQIETRKTNPTIGVLWKIASGLGVPFSDLIGESRLALSVLRRGDTQVLRSTDRKFESRPLMPAGGRQRDRDVRAHAWRPGPATRPIRTAPAPRSWWSCCGRAADDRRRSHRRAGRGRLGACSTPTCPTSTRIPATPRRATTT